MVHNPLSSSGYHHKKTCMQPTYGTVYMFNSRVSRVWDQIEDGGGGFNYQRGPNRTLKLPISSTLHLREVSSKVNDTMQYKKYGKAADFFQPTN
jgi:hypothetical protein